MRMKIKRLSFVKTYTRDNCFLVQEPWYRRYLISVNNKKNPYTPIQIFYINNGIVGIWENKKAIQWYKDELLKRNEKDKYFFEKSVKRYKKIINQLDFYWRKKYLNSTNELKKFIRLMDLGTKYFLIYYYSCVDVRNPQYIKNKAINIRRVDLFYDASDRLIRQTIHYLYPYISYNQALSLVYREISKPPEINVLKQRLKNTVFIPGKYFKIETLKDFTQTNQQYLFKVENFDSNIKVLKGRVAYKGKVVGRVRILKNKSQIATFKQGEILVSAMTTPVFLPTMKKAAAIVTDEGGITCHAAVVAREIKKPCIIGTKIATQVLKNGDLVEVDAERGIIKKKS
jgi:phosphohistidine swiveling domain-containing protein